MKISQAIGAGDTPQSICDFVRAHVDRHKQFVLATTDEHGNPWAVCLNLTHDTEYNFIWVSKKTTRHSEYVRRNLHVALCVFSEAEDVGDFGFYARALAREVTDTDELTRLLDIRYTAQGKPRPPLEDFAGDGEFRVYFAQLTDAWVNDARYIKSAVDLTLLAQN